MLELRNVYKKFSGTTAVDDVSFTARAGEITGYLGPNGSGKSTTMKMITGLLQTTSGKILVGGVPIERDLIAYKQRTGDGGAGLQPCGDSASRENCGGRFD